VNRLRCQIEATREPPGLRVFETDVFLRHALRCFPHIDTEQLFWEPCEGKGR